eukprot:3934691-Rhodomonas_salina.2
MGEAEPGTVENYAFRMRRIPEYRYACIRWVSTGLRIEHTQYVNSCTKSVREIRLQYKLDVTRYHPTLGKYRTCDSIRVDG